MKLTESKLRRIIRSVIAESMARNTYLDGWLRDAAVEKCSIILRDDCKYVPSDSDIAGITTSDGRSVLVLSGNRIELSDQLQDSERKKVLQYLETCGVLKNDRVCDGVFYTPTSGSTQKLI